jgi:hypothetical protein
VTVFDAPPDHIERPDVAVMEQRTADESRPLVEFYRGHGHVELWLPV